MSNACLLEHTLKYNLYIIQKRFELKAFQSDTLIMSQLTLDSSQCVDDYFFLLEEIISSNVYIKIFNSHIASELIIKC